MMYAEKGNKVYSITESDIQKYLDMGCKITDGKGKVLFEGVPHDLKSLREAYQKHIAEIADLKAEMITLNDVITALNDEISALKAENEELKKAKTSTKRTKSTAETKEVAE